MEIYYYFWIKDEERLKEQMEMELNGSQTKQNSEKSPLPPSVGVAYIACKETHTPDEKLSKPYVSNGKLIEAGLNGTANGAFERTEL